MAGGAEGAELVPVGVAGLKAPEFEAHRLRSVARGDAPRPHLNAPGKRFALGRVCVGVLPDQAEFVGRFQAAWIDPPLHRRCVFREIDHRCAFDHRGRGFGRQGLRTSEQECAAQHNDRRRDQAAKEREQRTSAPTSSERPPGVHG